MLLLAIGNIFWHAYDLVITDCSKYFLLYLILYFFFFNFLNCLLME